MGDVGQKQPSARRQVDLDVCNLIMQVSLAGACMHNHNKTVWAGISIKTFGAKKIEESNCARECQMFNLQPWKGIIFLLSSVSGGCILIDVILLGYLCQSIDQWDIAICSIKCHEQINNAIQLNHFNN